MNAGDTPDTATVIEALPFSVTGDTTGLTSTMSFPALGSRPDAFFSFTSAESLDVSVDTCGSSFDTEIGIFTLSPSGDLVLEINNDDSDFL